jgi:MoaF N-terminal domain
MDNDPVRGKKLQWTFKDGPMQGVTYEHVFRHDGTVTWAEPGKPAGDDSTARYEVARVNDDVFAVSYLGKSGYALTTVVDTKTGKIVSFASNEKSLVKQSGTSKEAGAG